MADKPATGQRLIELVGDEAGKITQQIAESLKEEGHKTSKGGAYSVKTLQALYRKAIIAQQESEQGAEGEQQKKAEKSEAPQVGGMWEQIQQAEIREAPDRGAEREHGQVKRTERGTRLHRDREAGGRSDAGATGEQRQPESEQGADREQEQPAEITQAPQAGASVSKEAEKEGPAVYAVDKPTIGFTDDEIVVLKQFASTLIPQDVDVRTMTIPLAMPTVAPGKKANHRIRRALLDESKQRAMKIWGIESVSDQDFLNFVLLWFAGHDRDSDELRANEPKAEEKKRK